MRSGLTSKQTSCISETLRVGSAYYKIKGRMMGKHETAIILPTYCEAKNIKKLIEKIENIKISPLIIVIDDSSPDGTSKIVENLQKKYSNILLVVRPSKMGLGTAIMDAFKILLSLKNKPKYVVTMDADFSHNPEDIPRLVSLVKKGYDLVIGSRYCIGGKTEGWSPIRILISRIANIFASTTLRTKVNDSTSGFRCYSLALINSVISKLHSQTYEIQIETVRQAVEGGFYIAEVPITFVNRKLGRSKLTLNEIKQFLFYIMKANVKKYFAIPDYNLALSKHAKLLAYRQMHLMPSVEYSKKII